LELLNGHSAVAAFFERRLPKPHWQRKRTMASDHAHDDDVVRLITASNPAQAHVVEQALRAEGISCRVVGDYLGASFGNLPGLQPEIWVHQRDRARAEEVLRDLPNLTEPETDEPEA
jgi:hypothetical protein